MSGFLVASTILIFAFVPFIFIPIQAISSLSSLILFTISLVFIFFLLLPIFKPLISKALYISSALIFEIPSISIFHIKLLNMYIVKKVMINITINIFLFLYLLNRKGTPFFSLIFTLHPLFLATSFIFLKSSIPILTDIILDFFRFIFHKKILLLIHILINLSM